MKTVKTAISIPVDVLEAAKKKAEERDISFSAYVSNCIKSALSGGSIDEGETPVPPSLSVDLEEIRERLTRLESERVIPAVIPEVIPEVIPGKPEVIPETVTTPKNAKATQPTIQLTEDIKSEMRKKITDLYEVRGLDYPTIHKMTGHPTSGYSWITEVQNGKKKSIYTSTYEALMSL